MPHATPIVTNSAVNGCVLVDPREAGEWGRRCGTYITFLVETV